MVFIEVTHEKGHIVELSGAAFLSGDSLQEVVESTMAAIKEAGGSPTPGIIEELRRRPDATISSNVPRIVDIALGTLRAERLGKRVNGWLFTDRMAEQSTHPEIASYHARAFGNCTHVLEICSGAGLDTLALARVAGHVTTIESDPAIAEVTRGNLAREGIENVTLIQASWPFHLGHVRPFDGVWADPSRRTELRRHRSGAQYDPPLASIPLAPIVGIKVGPGDDVLADGFISEYIGYGKDCRERVLWKSAHMRVPTVTLADKLVHWGRSSDAKPFVVPTAAYVIEPHKALIASGGVGEFLHEIGAGVFDPHIAYGAMNVEPPSSCWYERYRVKKIDEGISIRRIQQSIREFQWGPTTIFKKRGWENDPEDLRRALLFTCGGPPGVVIVMRVGDGHQTVYAELL